MDITLLGFDVKKVTNLTSTYKKTTKFIMIDIRTFYLKGNTKGLKRSEKPERPEAKLKSVLLVDKLMRID